jgi:hypothetical protein
MRANRVALVLVGSGASLALCAIHPVFDVAGNGGQAKATRIVNQDVLARRALWPVCDRPWAAKGGPRCPLENA